MLQQVVLELSLARELPGVSEGARGLSELKHCDAYGTVTRTRHVEERCRLLEVRLDELTGRVTAGFNRIATYGEKNSQMFEKMRSELSGRWASVAVEQIENPVALDLHARRNLTRQVVSTRRKPGHVG